MDHDREWYRDLSAKLSPWKPCHFPRSKGQTCRCDCPRFLSHEPTSEPYGTALWNILQSSGICQEKCTTATSRALITEMLPEKAVFGSRIGGALLLHFSTKL